MKALIAVEVLYGQRSGNMLTNGDFYRDGADYYMARQPARTNARPLSQLETLGYRVTVEPLTQAG